MLTVERLSVSYGKREAVTDFSAVLESGEVGILMGANGSGKSSALRAIAGLLPSRGQVVLDGEDLRPEARRERFAYMPQDIGSAPPLTITEVVMLGRLRSLGFSVPNDVLTAAEVALEGFGLGALAGRRVDEVSGGQRQLVYLAQTLFREPDVLLLDEPTAALDLRHQLLVLESVRAEARQRGIAVLIAMHDLTLAAQFADRLFCLRDGRLEAAGSVAEVMTEAEIARLYGVEVAVHAIEGGRLSVVPLRTQTRRV